MHEHPKNKNDAWVKDGGGVKGNYHLGYPKDGVKCCPVTRVARPATASAKPAASEGELLHYNLANAVKQNTTFIANAGVDLAKYHAQMAAAANTAVSGATSVEPGQQQLASAIAKEHGSDPTIEHLSALIALVQRMNPTDTIVAKGQSTDPKIGMGGRPVRGYLDLTFANDVALIPGGLAGIKKSAS